MKRYLSVLALCAFFVPAAALIAGCGGVPGNAVAEVDGDTIDKADFEHWMNVAAKSSGQKNASVPQPPDFTECIANARKNLPKPAKGQPKTTDAQLKAQCKQQYNQLRDQVVGLLLTFDWVEREAKEQGVKTTDAEVKKSFAQEKKQSFPKEADYQKFLKQSGRSEADILQQVRLRLLSTKIREKVIKGKDKVSDAQIKTYYEKNQSRFAQPERRDVSLVRTKQQAKAEQAKKALQSGESFKTVAKQYSNDAQSKAQGGKLLAVAKGQQEKAFDDAVFKAGKDKLVGPVKTPFGYYVFKVDKVTKASKQSLAQATPTIKQLLAAQNQDKAFNNFVKNFEKKWKDKTECREGYATTQCKNGPKATPTPTVATAPAQQAPTATPDSQK
jgi:foldase protein PrsA